MIDIITPENRPFFKAELDAMYEMRYRVAVEEWGWNIPGVVKNYEKDQFDTDETVYFLGYNDKGEVRACGRLNSTEKPHLLSDIFAGQCEFNGVPASPDIHEFSRFIIDGQGLTSLQKLQLSLKISLAITEHCVAQNIGHITFLAYKATYTKGLVLWKTRPLGLPKYYEEDDATYIAGIGEISAQAVKRIARFARTTEPVGQYRRMPDHSDIAA
jgi:acyl-homoserine lactone synthase